ncbi:MAG: hypothetical protein WB773_14785 [Isosphaeraceae bacterium]|jgi:hypothetical protein
MQKARRISCTGRCVRARSSAALFYRTKGARCRSTGVNSGRQTAMMIELTSSFRWLALKIQHPEIIQWKSLSRRCVEGLPLEIKSGRLDGY